MIAGIFFLTISLFQRCFFLIRAFSNSSNSYVRERKNLLLFNLFFNLLWPLHSHTYPDLNSFLAYISFFIRFLKIFAVTISHSSQMTAVLFHCTNHLTFVLAANLSLWSPDHSVYKKHVCKTNTLTCTATAFPHMLVSIRGCFRHNWGIFIFNIQEKSCLKEYGIEDLKSRSDINKKKGGKMKRIRKVKLWVE